METRCEGVDANAKIAKCMDHGALLGLGVVPFVQKMMLGAEGPGWEFVQAHLNPHNREGKMHPELVNFQSIEVVFRWVVQIKSWEVSLFRYVSLRLST